MDADVILDIMCIAIFITREWYLYHVYIEFLKTFLRSLVELGSWEPLTKLHLEELVLQLKRCGQVPPEAKQSLILRCIQCHIVTLALHIPHREFPLVQLGVAEWSGPSCHFVRSDTAPARYACVQQLKRARRGLDLRLTIEAGELLMLVWCELMHET